MSGPYQYRTDLGARHHTVPVNWILTDLPRSNLDQDILHSLGAMMTVCRIQRNNAEARIRAIAEGKKPAKPEASEASETEDDLLDVDQVARDQISTFIIQKFKGHDMARLVDAVLQAEGYLTKVSDPGPDGGVDILAGSGPLGFSSPRLCVQVKSQQSPVDVTVFRNLQGSMATFQADQGLLVCWGGFKSSVHQEARLSFFKIRLWDAGQLVEAILRNYDRFGKDLQAELPLKRGWMLVQEE